MRNLIIAFLFCLPILSEAQIFQDTGYKSKALWATSLMKPPADTLSHKQGIALMNGLIYKGNGTSWSVVKSIFTGGKFENNSIIDLNSRSISIIDTLTFPYNLKFQALDDAVFLKTNRNTTTRIVSQNLNDGSSASAAFIAKNGVSDELTMRSTSSTFVVNGARKRAGLIESNSNGGLQIVSSKPNTGIYFGVGINGRFTLDSAANTATINGNSGNWIFKTGEFDPVDNGSKVQIVGKLSVTDTVSITTLANTDSSNRAASTAFVKRNVGTGGGGGGTTYTNGYGLNLTGSTFKVDTSIIAAKDNVWALTGNSGTNSTNNFIGTKDAQPLIFRTNNNILGRLGTDNSVSLGLGANASNFAATSIGYYTNAGGFGSTSFGYGTNASGNYSTASGNQSNAIGDASFVTGTENNARSFSESVFGLYGTNYTPSSMSAFNATDRIFSVGNGIPSLRSDALVILKSGNVIVKGLSTGLTPPTTSGTLRMNVSDANGLQSTLPLPTSGGADTTKIPLTGTVAGKPISGNLDVVASGYWNLAANYAGHNNYLTFDNGSGNTNLVHNTPGSNKTARVTLGNSGAYLENNSNSKVTQIGALEDMVQIAGNSSTFKGIQGNRYYASYYNDTSFVQKKYVDSRILKGQYSTTASATTTFTVTLGETQLNNTYNLAIAPTSMLAGASYYISAKTTTSFDITYLTAVTGALSLDWTLFK